MRESDFAFANQVRAAAELRTPRTSRMLLGAIILLLISGTTWAHFAILDEVKRGNGRVVPSRQTQVVQSLEGGIVEEILVQEGAIVQQGQPLIRINDRSVARSPQRRLLNIRRLLAGSKRRVSSIPSSQGTVSIRLPRT